MYLSYVGQHYDHKLNKLIIPLRHSLQHSKIGFFNAVVFKCQSCGRISKEISSRLRCFGCSNPPFLGKHPRKPANCTGPQWSECSWDIHNLWHRVMHLVCSPKSSVIPVPLQSIGICDSLHEWLRETGFQIHPRDGLLQQSFADLDQSAEVLLR